MSCVVYLAPGYYQARVIDSVATMKLFISLVKVDEICKPCIDTIYDALAKIGSDTVMAAWVAKSMVHWMKRVQSRQIRDRAWTF
ncbi:MAG: hypothetical protein COC05_01375 [Gammaproteobacteria bacterium]|nr:MAG: hypothetical protein COC05_01375 [Gammaproteobacteria bacterium]